MKDPMKTWNIIVSQFDSHKNKQEVDIQHLWEKLLSEKFGYSSFDGEIIPQKKIPIGSNTRALIPDIILCKNGREVCAVELKTEETKLVKAYENQLFSYLKQEKLKFGILICDHIYLYRYDYFKNDDEQLKIEISFQKNNEDGELFVNQLDHDLFDETNFTSFIENKINFLNNVNAIKRDITNELITEELKKYFSNQYSQKEIDYAFDGLNFSIGNIHSDSIKLKDTNQTNKVIQPTENDIPDWLAKALITGGKSPSLKLIEFLKKNKIISQDAVCTVAKINKNQKNYWANPDTGYINLNWYLILNDSNKRELHLFYIPANSLSLSDVKTRKDKPQYIDLKIDYKNPNYKCKVCKVEFKQYFFKTIKY